MYKKFLSPTLLIALAPLTLAACGGSDEEGGGDEEAVVTTIETSATSFDPADCETYSTQAFLEQTYFETGKGAVQSYNGQTLAVSLLQKGGEWKIDRIDGFVDFDRDIFIAEFEEGVDESSATPAETACIMKAVNRVDDAELETLVIGGSEAHLNKLTRKC